MKTNHRNFVRLLIVVVLFHSSGCTTTAVAPKDAAPEVKIVTTARFLTRSELLAQAANDGWETDLFTAWPTLKPESPKLTRNTFLGGIGSGLLVWAGKQIWGAIANQFKEEAKKHKGDFGAVDSKDWNPNPEDAFVAIELRRDVYEPKPQNNVFCAVILIRPIIGSEGDKFFENSTGRGCQLLPIYWREDQASVEKLWGGNDKKLTATLSVVLRGIWHTATGEPVDEEIISAEWVLKNYKLGEKAISVTPADFVEIDEHGSSAKVQVKGLGPSRYFPMPIGKAMLTGKVQVAEMDASKAIAILEKLGGAVESQTDTIGGIIKDGLD